VAATASCGRWSRPPKCWPFPASPLAGDGSGR
jgi:hypothetical protein